MSNQSQFPSTLHRIAPYSISLAISSLFAAALSLASNPAGSLTLEETLSELPHAPKVQRAQAAFDEASWKKTESYSGFLPNLSAGGNYLFSKKYAFLDVQLPGAASIISIPQIIPTSSFTLNMNWTLFDGFANVENLRSAMAFNQAAGYESQWTSFTTELETILLFYQAVAAQTLKDVAEQNIKTLQDHLNDANLFKRAGLGTDFDVLRVEVQGSEAKTELLNAEDNVNIAKLRLLEVLGEAASTHFKDRDVAGALPVLEPTLIDAVNYSEAERPDLQALQKRTEGYDHLSSAANRFWIPKFSLYGQYQQYNNRNDKAFDTANYRDAYLVGFSASWNLFDGLTSLSRERQAVAKQAQFDKDFEIQRLKSAHDFEFWKRKYLYFCSVYRSRASDLQKSTESVRLARAGKKAGVRTNTDLLDAELELFRARAGLVNAQIGSVEALIRLELATGKKLYSFH